MQDNLGSIVKMTLTSQNLEFQRTKNSLSISNLFVFNKMKVNCFYRSLSTNHRVRLLTPLWVLRSKSYFRGKDDLRKEFSIARVYLTCFNYRLSYQSAGRKYLSSQTSLSSLDTSEVDSLPNTRLTYLSLIHI